MTYQDSIFAVGGVAAWMRYTSMRQLVWNRDYNVKPRELSAAQMNLTDTAVRIYWEQPDYRDILRMLLTSVGRGGAGNIGQVTLSLSWDSIEKCWFCLR